MIAVLKRSGLDGRKRPSGSTVPVVTMPSYFPVPRTDRAFNSLSWRRYAAGACWGNL